MTTKPDGHDHTEQRELQGGRGLRLAKFSIEHPVTICMVFVCFVVLGAISIFKIPLVLAPDISFPFVAVIVPYENATPGQVEESIAKPLEEALSTMPHVTRMTSNSRADSAFISLGFDWGQNMEWLRSEIREKVDQIRSELPADVENVMVRNWSTTDQPILDGQLSSKFDLGSSYDFLDRKIKKPLERVPGVAEVEIYGAQPKEVDIYLRLDDIRRYGVDVGALVRRLDNANLNLSLGRVEDGVHRYGAITRGTMKSLEEIRSFPVNDRGITLQQVASIYMDNPVRNSGRHLNGQRAIGFSIRKTSEANTVDTVNAVMAQIDEINEDPALEGIEVLVWWNQGTEITKALSGLVESGTIGAILAVLVLYLFLRKFGATLAIGFAIPFSIIATIGFLYMFGKTLNVLSMMGLMLACGMLVDNAVVVLESIFQHLEKGRDRKTAAQLGTQEVTTAVIAATLTSIIIFVPLVFGKTTSFSIWLADTGTSIMLALLCSLFISLTLIPLGVARFFRIDVTEKSRVERLLARATAAAAGWIPRRAAGADARKTITDRYLGAMGWTMRHRYLTGFVLVPLVVGGSFTMMGKLPDNSAEAQDLQDLVIQYEFSENLNYLKIEENYVQKVEDYLLANKEEFKIKQVFSWYGNNEASTRVYFDKESITLEALKEIRPKIQEGLPEIAGADIKMGRQEGAENQNWISANLYGEDSSTLQRLASEVKAKLRTKPGFSEIYTDVDKGKEEVRIRLNREEAKKYGVSARQVGDVLNIVVRGRKLRGYRTDEGEVELWVKLQQGDRGDLDDLRQIVVGGAPDGKPILLGQVARLEVEKTPGVIRREDRRAYTWMEMNYTGEKKDDGLKVVTEVLDGIEYPPGYGWTFGFWTQRQQNEDRDFLFNILLALFMVYFVMASLFESYAQPFAIMFSLPFALVGVTWTLWLTGTPFNLMSRIGLMVLLGVVVNNGIVLLDHINNLRRFGMARNMAIVEGCRERFRPIMMTASTTIVGLLPLALGDSGLFELRYFPLARTVMGGLAASTVLTLIVLPTYYTFFDDLTEWARRVWFQGVDSQDTPPQNAPEEIAGFTD